jgi:hypothetical protein
MSTEAAPVDREATEGLAIEIFKAVNEHFRSRPQSRLTTYEIVNALAAVLAAVAAGTGDDQHETLAWFELALRQEMAASGATVTIQ